MTASATTDPRVRFVVVPFLPTEQPALGVSSLLSVLREEGIEGDIRYLNLAYGEHIGWDFYNSLVGKVPGSFLPGEMIFSRALWGEDARSFEEYDQHVRKWHEEMSSIRVSGTPWEAAVQWWQRHSYRFPEAIEDAPRVISAWADELLADNPRVVGFTSTFQQSVAALALAQEVRRRVPPEEVAIIFGGANCEDEMGRAMADNFDFIDCVVSGEAEAIIVDLVRSLADGGEGESPPRFVQGTMVRSMDDLPLPNFDDYYAELARTTFDQPTNLAVESSRGCWWGVKSHCTFCGLNGGTMAFRSKSAPRFAAELEELSRRYNTRGFAVTDNILDMSYLRTLFPDLVKRASGYSLFYETKSNLRKDQVVLLAAAGITAIQPGIESFSTAILKLMGKGTTMMQNAQLLKWCKELGINVYWNVLFGFSGEDPEEYERMADLFEVVSHLEPPRSCAQMRLDRFGPYWSAPERYGISNMRHFWSYDLVFSGLPEEERERLAYFFEHEYEDGSDPWTVARPVIEATAAWRRAAGARATLELRMTNAGPTVFDTRPCRTEESFHLTAQGLALLRALDGFRRRQSLPEAIRQQEGVEITDAECEQLLSDFIARRFIIEENDLVLSLVIDPDQRQRIADRQVALRAEHYGFNWPEDFPDPDQAKVVRDAMLALGANKRVPQAPSPEPSSTSS